MIFHPRIQKLSSDTILTIVDDMIEVGRIAANKDAFRLKILNDRLVAEKERTMFKSSDIKKAYDIMSSDSTSDYQFKRAFIKLSKQLSDYYAQLTRILQTLR